MRIRRTTLLAFFLALYVPAHADIKFKSYYEDVPKYESMGVFSMEPGRTHADLIEALRKAPVAIDLCGQGSVKPTVTAVLTLRTNVCDPSARSEVASLISRLAPELDPQRLAFRKVDLNRDKAPELLIEYIDLVGDYEVKDPYLSLWLLQFDGTRFNPIYVGPFLVGEIIAERQFGQTDSMNMIFVRHQSCTECHPWIYMSVVDLMRKPNGGMFQFTYSANHDSFGDSIEYVLPGEGHSVDAEVETRTVTPSKDGPHLLQRFELDSGATEWWAFTCADLKCDFEMTEGPLPVKYERIWRSAKKL